MVEFNKRLDELERNLGLKSSSHMWAQTEDMRVLQNQEIDEMISFDTKVDYYYNYFEKKTNEMQAKAQNQEG